MEKSENTNVSSLMSNEHQRTLFNLLTGRYYKDDTASQKHWIELGLEVVETRFYNDRRNDLQSIRIYRCIPPNEDVKDKVSKPEIYFNHETKLYSKQFVVELMTDYDRINHEFKYTLRLSDNSLKEERQTVLDLFNDIKENFGKKLYKEFLDK